MKRYPRSFSLVSIVLTTSIVVIITTPAYMKRPVVKTMLRNRTSIMFVDENADGKIDKKLLRLPNGLYEWSITTTNDQQYFQHKHN